MLSRSANLAVRFCRPSINAGIATRGFSGSIIDGKQTAKAIRAALKDKVSNFKAKYSRVPGLAVVLVGDRPDSQAYVRSKIKATENAGMISKARYFDMSCSKDDLVSCVEELNSDPEIDGILVQLPLPGPLKDHSDDIIQKIHPGKDVDGLSLVNIGQLHYFGDAPLKACTPAGCIRLLKEIDGFDIAGKDAVVLGRSNIVGKPIAQLLTTENATVTVCHSKTKNLPEVVRRADIVIAAIGRPLMVKGDWIKPGAVVIDVGINKVDGRLVGDVDFESAKEVASHITPVPGGVGPMTIAMLLENTLTAAHMRSEA